MKSTSVKTKINKGSGKGKFKSCVSWILLYDFAGRDRAHKIRDGINDKLHAFPSELEHK